MILILPFCAIAQVEETFSDGNFTVDPTWEGDTELFIVSDNVLQSQSAGAATYYLSTPSTQSVQTEWSFFINLKFSTSSANYVDIYLLADVADLNLVNNGYFVRIGNTPDEVSLYSLIDGVDMLLIDGTDGMVNSASDNRFNIKVKRSDVGMWEMFIDDGATSNYMLEGSTVENTIRSSSFFGFKIVQSTAASPVNNHYFDAISINEIVPDTQAPAIARITPTSETTLDVKYNEPVDENSAALKTNYVVNNGIGIPVSTALDLSDKSLVHLNFDNSFVNNIAYELTIVDVEDLTGNAIVSLRSNFTFFIPEIAEVGDLIINEIMPDPNPPLTLPDAEYVEILNNSDKFLDLADFSLSGATISETEIIIAPGTFYILCAENSATLFNDFDNVLGIPSWNTLTNTGETITLKQFSNNLIINEVSYTDKWYKSTTKNTGGWSIERIDKDNKCSNEDNWTASVDPRGGTPSELNSVNASKPDLTGPILQEITLLSNDTLLVVFNENLDSLSITTAQYTLNNDISVSKVDFISFKVVQLILSTPLSLQQRYTLEVENLKDCSGNIISNDKNHLSFGVPEEALTGDIVLNEVLFNPRTDGPDFVEIYNNSNKYIDLQNWTLANKNSDGDVDNQKYIVERPFTFMPESYLVLTKDPLTLGNEYPHGIVSTFLEISSIPTYANDAGSVVLLQPDSTVYEVFDYHEDYHHQLLNSVDGVSLERISFESDTNDPNSWHSAANTVLATPGYLNSQSKNNIIGDNDVITISPAIFIPDQNGLNDFTTIHYEFDTLGYVVGVHVIDDKGRLIKTIIENATLPLSGDLKWDGTMQDGRKARIGAYLVYVEAFDLTGNVKKYRERVIIGSEW